MRQTIARVSSNRAWLWSWLRIDEPQTLFLTHPRARIFLLSFAMLFFELLCLRWIPSYVRYLSYFANFLLLTSFLGIGLGMLAARRTRFWFPPFPLMLLGLVIIVVVNRFDLRITSTDVLYYGAGEAQSARAENFLVLPLIFELVTACFIPLSRSFGRLFTQVPLVSTYGGWGRAAVIMVGPRLKELEPGKFGPYSERDPAPGDRTLRVIGEGYVPLTGRVPLATDDWPFLYLREPSFALIYVAGLGMVALFALAGTLTVTPRGALRRFDWHMFFLDAAFMLLEVKSLTTFAFLFGSTWLVNSLVFFAIMSSVLLAVLVNSRLKVRRISPLYLLLFGVLVVNLLLPQETLLLDNPLLRYLLASALAFAPVGIANIIFANSFRESQDVDIAFASNLLGIMVGGWIGILQYVDGLSAVAPSGDRLLRLCSAAEESSLSKDTVINN